MSTTWYPVINYEICTECGTCVNKCSHGVYNKEKAPRPVVVKPEGCIQGCHGCGNLCPNGAIDYYGEIVSTAGEGDCCGSAKSGGGRCSCG